MTRPDGPRTGAEIDATPISRSETDCAHPRLRTADRFVAVKLAPCKPRWSLSGSSHAKSTCAADPAFIERVAPIGIESRRPTVRSAAATHTR